MTAKTTAKIPPKPGKETLYLEPDDEITAIIDKMEGAKEKVVALVLPKRAATLQSIVNMRLLKRSADTAGKSVVLITNDTALIPLAGAVKLHVAKNLQSKPEIPPAPAGSAKSSDKAADIPDEDVNETPEGPVKLDYHRSIGELATSHQIDEPDETIDLDDGDDAEIGSKATEKTSKIPKNKKLKIPNFDRFRVMLGLGILAIILLIVFLVLAINVWPQATITIQTESSPISANLSLTTSDSAKTLDEVKGIIPATLKTTKQTATQQVTATGQQNNGEKSLGSVTLSLTDCSQSSVIVPAGTGISSNGLTFITQSSASMQSVVVGGVCKNSTFPSVSSASVNVRAQTGGAKYNIGPSSFSVKGFSNVSGTSSAAMTGGTDNITTVVSQADLDSAKGKVSSADTDKFTKDFEKQLSDAGGYVLSATLKPSDPVVTSSPALGQPATAVTATIQITYTVLVVQKSDLSKALTDALTKQVNPKKQKISIDNVLKGATVTVQNQSSPTAVNLNVSQTTTAVPIISVLSVQKIAGGQKSADIRSVIGGLPGVKSVDVKMSPFWVSHAPKKPSHVHVILHQVKDNGK